MKPHEPLVIPTKASNPELVQPTPFSNGLVNDFDVFEFLIKKPGKDQVITYLGLPDSAWVNNDETTMIWYYFVENLNDFNAVEINVKTFKVTGFEWD